MPVPFIEHRRRSGIADIAEQVSCNVTMAMNANAVHEAMGKVEMELSRSFVFQGV